MKTINNIYEASILSDIDNQIKSGDVDMENLLKQQINDLFVNNIKRSFALPFSTDTTNILSKRKLFIENCIYWDSDILVVDFAKWYTINNDNSIPTLAILKSKIPNIRVIDNIAIREKSKLLETIRISCDNFDLNKIDSNSIINGIVYDGLISKNLLVKDNKISFNVNFIEYKNCYINKIYPKWPKCKLEFNQATWLNVFANFMGVNKNDIDIQHVTNKIQINSR